MDAAVGRRFAGSHHLSESGSAQTRAEPALRERNVSLVSLTLSRMHCYYFETAVRG